MTLAMYIRAAPRPGDLASTYVNILHGMHVHLLSHMGMNEIDMHIYFSICLKAYMCIVPCWPLKWPASLQVLSSVKGCNTGCCLLLKGRKPLASTISD
jgi:hypothetical protein